MHDDTFAPIDSYLAYAKALARELASAASARGASQMDVHKILRIAAGALPILLFELHAGEIEPGPDAFVACLRLVSCGISSSALQRRDIPLELREALLPALRPDTFETHIKWWDEVALPNWVGPYFEDLGRAGAFDSAVSAQSVAAAH